MTTTTSDTGSTDSTTTVTTSGSLDAAGQPITVDIFHDTVCPWCRIGVASLRRALDGWDGPPVELHWHPFLLDPDIAPDGEPFRERLESRKGQDLTPMFARVSEAGTAVGVAFDWAAIQRAPNSIRSHLLYAILPEEHRTAMVERIGVAYFEQGRDIGDLETLRAIAAEGGIDPELAGRALERTELQTAIVSEAAQAAQLGISGVPLFILDNRLAVNGAQSPEAFRSALRQVVDSRAEGGSDATEDDVDTVTR